MKRVLPLSLALLAAILPATAPANAQYFNDTRYNNRFDTRFNNRFDNRYGSNINATQLLLQQRINAGMADGRLNSREAARLQAKLSRIADLEARMRSTGFRLSMRERAALDNQLSSLNFQITRDLNDFERRRIGFWTDNRRWY